MKQVYDCEQFIALGTRCEFKHTSIWDHLHLLDAKQALDVTNRTYYENFKDFFEACEEGKGLYQFYSMRFNDWSACSQYFLCCYLVMQY